MDFNEKLRHLVSYYGVGGLYIKRKYKGEKLGEMLDDLGIPRGMVQERRVINEAIHQNKYEYLGVSDWNASEKVVKAYINELRKKGDIISTRCEICKENMPSNRLVNKITKKGEITVCNDCEGFFGAESEEMITCDDCGDEIGTIEEIMEDEVDSYKVERSNSVDTLCYSCYQSSPSGSFRDDYEEMNADSFEARYNQNGTIAYNEKEWVGDLGNERGAVFLGMDGKDRYYYIHKRIVKVVKGLKNETLVQPVIDFNDYRQDDLIHITDERKKLAKIFDEVMKNYDRHTEYRRSETFGVESNDGKIFVYQGYRDAIDKFHGKFDTLEEAENHIYEDLLETFLRQRESMLEKLNDPATNWEREYYNKEELQKVFDECYSDIEAKKKRIKEITQTPKGSIQQSGSWLWNNTSPPMYQGYSQRYEDGNGNYPYIVFDPSFTPPSTEMKAESYNVEFNDWAEQEMLTHGEDISFKKWAKDESEKHGDMDLEDWAEHEEESHDERYGAETFEADGDLRVWAKDMEKDHLGYFISKNKDGWETWRGLCGITSDKGVSRGFDVSKYDGSYGRRCRKCLTAYKKMSEESHDERYGAERYWDKDTDSYREIYNHSIEVREFPKSSSVYQNGKLVKQYKGQGHFTNATAYAQKLENDYVPKSFFSENMTSKLKSPYVIGAFVMGLGLPYISSFLNSKKDK